MQTINQTVLTALTGKGSGSPESLTDHQRACINLYLSVARARGLSIGSGNATAIETGLTWSRFLDDIPAGRLTQVLDLAMDAYAFDDAPFGVPQLRQAWNQLNSASEAAPLDEPESVKAIKKMAQCDHDYQFITADDSDPSIFAGFWECSKCGNARPRIQAKASPKAVEYLKGVIQ